MQKKKDLKKEAKKCSNNNKKSVKDTFSANEEDFDYHCIVKVSEHEPVNSVQQVGTELNDSCSLTMANEVDTEPDTNPPLSQSSGNTSENKHSEVELEEKKEGFIGPRLPRMLTDEEVKAVFDRLLGDKYK